MSQLTARTLAAGAIALLLQAAAVPHLGTDNVYPELLLLVAISAALAGGARHGVITAFCGGMAMDSLNGLPLGVSAFAYGLAALVVASAAQHASDVWWTTAALAFGATIVSVVAIVVVAAALGYSDVGVLHTLRVIFVVGIVNAALVPLVTRCLGRNERRSELAW